MWIVRGEIQRSPPPPPPISISLTLTSPPPHPLHLLPWLSPSVVAVPLTHHYLMWWWERWGSKTSLTLSDLREMGRQTLVLSKTAVQIYGKFSYVHVFIYCVCACMCHLLCVCMHVSFTVCVHACVIYCVYACMCHLLCVCMHVSFTVCVHACVCVCAVWIANSADSTVVKSCPKLMPFLFFFYWGRLSIWQFVGTADLKSQLLYHFLLVLFLFLFVLFLSFPVTLREADSLPFGVSYWQDVLSHEVLTVCQISAKSSQAAIQSPKGQKQWWCWQDVLSHEVLTACQIAAKSSQAAIQSPKGQKWWWCWLHAVDTVFLAYPILTYILNLGAEV